MTKSILIYAPKILFDFIFDIIYFLPWWYSKGFIDVFKKSLRFLRNKEQELALLVWLKNITKPMYDEYNWKNLIKSVILRVGQILFRFVILLFWLLMVLLSLILYIILPILVIWQIIYQFI